MRRVKVNPSLYEPIEVEGPDGKIYTTLPLKPEIIRKTTALLGAAKTPAENVDAVIEQMNLTFGVPKEELENFDIRVMGEMLRLVTDEVEKQRSAPIGTEAGEGKNPPTPGPQPTT